jgi:hypothetical protein
MYFATANAARPDIEPEDAMTLFAPQNSGLSARHARVHAAYEICFHVRRYCGCALLCGGLLAVLFQAVGNLAHMAFPERL